MGSTRRKRAPDSALTHDPKVMVTCPDCEGHGGVCYCGGNGGYWYCDPCDYCDGTGEIPLLLVLPSAGATKHSSANAKLYRVCELAKADMVELLRDWADDTEMVRTMRPHRWTADQLRALADALDHHWDEEERVAKEASLLAARGGEGR